MLVIEMNTVVDSLLKYVKLSNINRSKSFQARNGGSCSAQHSLASGVHRELFSASLLFFVYVKDVSDKTYLNSTRLFADDLGIYRLFHGLAYNSMSYRMT